MLQNGLIDRYARREAEGMRGARAIQKILEEGRALETYLGAYLKNEAKSQKHQFADAITTLEDRPRPKTGIARAISTCSPQGATYPTQNRLP